MAKCPDYEEEINEGTELNTAPKKYKSYGQYSDKKSLLVSEQLLLVSIYTVLSNE